LLDHEQELAVGAPRRGDDVEGIDELADPP
jgi:hypothetical protein